MKKLLSLLALTVMSIGAMAQDVTLKDLKAAASKNLNTDTAIKADKNGWIKGGLLSINLTQIGNSNWIAAGGDKFSLSLATSLNVFANRKWSRNSWDNVLDINYALVNTTTLGVRKVNDRLDLISKYGYQPKNWKNLSIASLAQLRSQLSSGYQYDYFGTTTKRRNSGFFAPAYITIAPLGIDWHPNSRFSIFGSPLVARWIIASNGPYSYASQGGVFNGNIETPLAKLYGVDPAKPNHGEFGAFVTATLKKDIMKNVNYYSKIDLFSNYLKKAKNVDLFWTNQVRMKVNKWIQVSYTLDMLYDDDVKNPVRPDRALGLQILSTLGVGFAAKW
ncbi:MAG: DUF3078 domain-containing protein [Ferruginibacter sp.]